MSKSGKLYLGSLVTFIVGIWAILATGSHLQAPHALGGVWEPAGTTGSEAVPFAISQSGRFLTIKPHNGTPSPLDWEGETTDSSGARIIRLRGNGQYVEVYVAPATQPGQPPVYRFTFQGALNGSWTAVRTGDEPRNRSPQGH